MANDQYWERLGSSPGALPEPEKQYSSRIERIADKASSAAFAYSVADVRRFTRYVRVLEGRAMERFETFAQQVDSEEFSVPRHGISLDRIEGRDGYYDPNATDDDELTYILRSLGGRTVEYARHLKTPSKRDLIRHAAAEYVGDEFHASLLSFGMTRGQVDAEKAKLYENANASALLYSAPRPKVAKVA